MAMNIVTGPVTFKSLKPLDLSTCTRSEIKDYFENSYHLDESLFTSLKDESVFYKCPDILRLPLIFYYGHTAAVFCNKLVLAGLLEERINLRFETIFETGVDEMPWDDTENLRIMGGPIDWPSVKDVYEYRIKVKERILKIIEEHPLELPITFDDPLWSLVMGMEHERIHVETSSVLIRQLPVEMVTKPEGFQYGPIKCGDGVVTNPMVRVEPCDVILGKPNEFPSYGWDNEYGRQDYHVPAFEASKYKITNREFLEFVEAGGYENKSYWSTEALKWLEYRPTRHPSFWVCDEGCESGCGGDLTTYSRCNLPKQQGKKTYKYRCMFDVIDLPMDWPVEVNSHEAKAYCSWKGPHYRLPTEAEHHALRGTMKPLSEGTSSDPIHQDHHNFNMNCRYGSSTPVNMYPPNDAGFCDVFGNVWEWAEDHFNGLPGHKRSYFYDDFSTPIYDGYHSIIMGGSWVSTGDSASRFARYAFRRHFFQHLGFRLVRSVDTSTTVDLPGQIINTAIYPRREGPDPPLDTKDYKMNAVESTNRQFRDDTYERLTSALEDEYLKQEVDVVHVVGECIEKVRDSGVPTDRVIHLGCRTGRGTFELCKHFSSVLGQDFSGAFISACQKLQKDKSFRLNGLNAKLPETIEPSKVVFKQLNWLPNEVEDSDLVLFSSLDRVTNPRAWTSRFKEIVRKNGLLAVTSQSGWDAKKLLTPAYLGERFQEASPTVELPTGTRVMFFKRKI